MPLTIADLLDEAGAGLPRGEGLPDPRREARFLLGCLLARPESHLLSHGSDAVADPEAARFRDWVRRRATGEPAHYIVGTCPFAGRQFLVRPGVLIPRPETEMLVARALTLPLPAQPRILDVGTGSGCIAVTLALELPGAIVVASDVSLSAAAVAAANARRLGATMATACGDIVAHAGGPFDLIAANLPYVPAAEVDTLPVEIKAFEPHLALDGGADGTVLLRRLVGELPRLLRRGGFVLLEVGSGHAAALAGAFGAAGLVEVERVTDLDRVERLLALRRP